MSDNAVSVVIPSYNRASLIGATVRSVLAQTVPPQEVLIIDDGSTDETASVCAQFPSPVRYVKQQNTGLPGARNRGIREAQGDWIALCDSDDIWHPRKLEVQLSVLAEVPQTKWCLTGCGLIDPDGAPVPTPSPAWERVFAVFQDHGRAPAEHFSRYLSQSHLEVDPDHYTIFTGDAFELLFDGNIALPSSALIARSLFQNIGMFDESIRVAEETEYFHRAAAAAPVAIVFEALVDYRVGHGSIISSGDPTALIRNALTSLERATQLRPQLSPAGMQAYRRGKRRLRTRLAYARLAQLDPRGARRILFDQMQDNRRASTTEIGILVASLLPSPVLRGLHRAKQFLRRK